jgi:hypothetical protein
MNMGRLFIGSGRDRVPCEPHEIDRGHFTSVTDYPLDRSRRLDVRSSPLWPGTIAPVILCRHSDLAKEPGQWLRNLTQ